MSIAQILGDAITRWLSEKDKRSLSMLARLSKVSYSTVRRVMQQESKPTMDTALKLADVIMTKIERIEFAKQHAPSLAQNIAGVAHKADNEMLEYLNDTAFAPAILLASHSTGTNSEEVRFWFGNDTVLKFEELVNSGHLSRCDGNWKLEKDIGSVNRATARELLGVFCRIAPAANDEIDNASVGHVGWESVTPQTAVAIFHLAVNFIRDAVKLSEDKANRGDVLVFFGSFFNVMKGVEALK